MCSLDSDFWKTGRVLFGCGRVLLQYLWILQHDRIWAEESVDLAWVGFA